MSLETGSRKQAVLGKPPSLCFRRGFVYSQSLLRTRSVVPTDHALSVREK